MSAGFKPCIGATDAGRSILQRRLETAGLWELVKRIARERRVDPRAILGRRQSRQLAAARHHVWHVIRSSTTLSLPEIGRMFGVDHTTVLNGDQQHARRLAEQMGKAA